MKSFATDAVWIFISLQSFALIFLFADCLFIIRDCSFIIIISRVDPSNIGARFIALGQLWLDQMPSLNGRAQYLTALILDKQFQSLMHVFYGIHELIPSENG